MESIETQAEVCPKCHADRSEDETECMKCGIIFAKYRPLPVRLSDALAGARAEPAGSESSWWVTAKQWLIETDVATDSMTLYGRAIVFLGLLWWGRIFIMTPLETNYTGESFLHLINLPFHEAGHLIFSPFGRFMMILGGSLGQVLMPLICLGTFLIKTRDPFGASVALWWTAESIMDVAPYINDARDMELISTGWGDRERDRRPRLEQSADDDGSAELGPPLGPSCLQHRDSADGRVFRLGCRRPCAPL